MVQALRNQFQLLAIFLIWFISGYFLGIMSAVIILPTLLLLFYKEHYWWAVLGLMMLIIFSDNLSERMAFAGTIKGFYLLLLSALVLINGKKFLKFNNIFYAFIPYFLLAVICLYWSETMFVSIQKTVSYILLFLIVPNLIVYEYKQKGTIIFKELMVFIFLIFILSLFLAILVPEIGTSHEGRWRGIFGNPNGLGLYLLVTYIFYEVTNYIFPGIYSKQFRWLMYILFIVLIVYCGSRGTMLAIMSFWASYLLFGINSFMGFLFIAFVVVFLNEIFEWMISLIQTLGYSEELRVESLEEGSGRLIAWGFAWKEIQRNTFILGNGIGYDEFYMRSNYNYLSALGHEGGVHNTYLILWLNTGLIGLVSYFIAFLQFFIRAFKRNKMSLSVMLAVMISINFEPWLASSLNPFTIIFLILLTLLMSRAFYEKEEQDDEMAEEK